MNPILLEFFDFHFSGKVRIRFVPQPVFVLGVNIEKGDNMAVHKCTPQLNPVNPADNITSRPVQVNWGDGTPSITLDMIDPTASFDANDGQTGNVTPLGDINVTGQGPTSGTPFQFTVTPTPPPPQGLPGPQSVIGVTIV